MRIINEICTFAPKSKIKAGEATKDGQYIFFTSSEDESKKYNEYIYDGEGIIMGTGGNATLHYYNGKYATSTDCLVLLPDKEIIDCKYLYYFFLSNMSLLEAGFKGAGLKHTNKKYIGNIEINQIPTKDQQLRVVSILDTVTSLIVQQQKEINLLDELIKSRFVEMFGDPVHNRMNWNTKPLAEMCKVIVDCPHSTPNYTSSNTGYMCIRTSIVKKNRIMWDKIEYIPKDEYYQRIQRKKPEKGDIIYTREGAILGIAAIIDRDCSVALGQRSMLLSPDRSLCTPEFLSVAMNFETFLNQALNGISGSASPHINVGDVKLFQMIQPPIKKQQEYSTFVTRIEQQKATVQQSINKLETLKKSLMQEYFG